MPQLTISSKYRMPSGYEMPVLGFGVYQTPAAECEAIVLHALRSGYRHVDSAIAYRNEAPCASAMRKSGIPRSELFFTTKIRPGGLGYEATKEQIAQSLKETGLDYIDLILIHAPYGGRSARNATWLALREAQIAGRVRSIGVSNYGLHHLTELAAYIDSLDASKGPGSGGAVDAVQYELHPWLMRREIVDWCRSRGAVVQAFSPLVRGSRWGHDALQKAAAKAGKTEAQVLLRWSLEREFVPLPKTVAPARVEENAGVFGWELGQEETKKLDTHAYEPCTWDPTTSHD